MFPFCPLSTFNRLPPSARLPKSTTESWAASRPGANGGSESLPRAARYCRDSWPPAPARPSPAGPRRQSRRRHLPPSGWSRRPPSPESDWSGSHRLGGDSVINEFLQDFVQPDVAGVQNLPRNGALGCKVFLFSHGSTSIFCLSFDLAIDCWADQKTGGAWFWFRSRMGFLPSKIAAKKALRRFSQHNAFAAPFSRNIPTAPILIFQAGEWYNTPVV